MAVKLHAAEVFGLDAHIIDVEVDLTGGHLHSFSIVGLPDKAVEESQERVSAAIKNSGFTPPQKSRKRVVVSLAPADVKKEGPVFDLSIALAFLLALGETKFDPRGKLFLGELALDGSLRPIRGVLPLVREAARRGMKDIFVPQGNGAEAALISGVSVYEASSLRDVLDHFEGSIVISPLPKTTLEKLDANFELDFSDIRGQQFVKRGLEIAAAGSHHVALVGPPGTGKTLLAKALISILPSLSFEEMLEVTSIHSVVGLISAHSEDRVVARQNDSVGLVRHRPFRNPHHTASYVSLVGGGAFPRPGEITLAHRGVLFLDEFPEFERRVLESLRQPLEDHKIVVSRARGTIVFPAQVMLIAAMNPCPCGNAGSEKECVCSQAQLQKYRRKISGPIMDRIDMWLWVPVVEHEKLISHHHDGEPSINIRNRVERARAIQNKRFTGTSLHVNSEISVRTIKKWCTPDEAGHEAVATAVKNLQLSARAYHRVLKLARTIADLDGSEQILKPHILEALRFRPQLSEMGI